MTVPIFNSDGSPAEESIALLANSFVAVLHEIRCDPFYWCGTPIFADRHHAMIDAYNRVFGIDYPDTLDDRYLNLWRAAEERGWPIYVEQVRPKVDEDAIAKLFDSDGTPRANSNRNTCQDVR